MDSKLMGLEDLPTTGPTDDLSSIAWVHEELRRSLETAHKSLRRFLKDAEAVTGSDIDSVDPGVLRAARSQIHQGVGALELVGLPAAAIVLRASETAIQRAIAKPQALTPELVSDLEHASFGLLDYLSRLLGGKQVSSLSLFPAYRAVQEAVEAERVHPADLWAVDWRWREVASDPDVVPRQADATVRAEFEGHLLSLMRGTQALTAAAKMSEICAGLGAGSTHPQVRTFWNLAAAMFEAQHNGLLGFDVFTKRVASRLLAQFRLLQRGDSDVSERLARDVLFFCSQAAPAGRGIRVPRLAAVRDGYGFVEQVPTDYTHSVLGRFDPAIVAHAKKRVAAAKEAWSATAGGEMHRIAGLSEQFALVGDSLRRLFPFGESFAAELQTAVQQTQAAQAAPPAALAMEVATSLLYLDAALEDGDFDQPEHAERIKRLGERLSLVRQKVPPEPLEPWMEELYRRVSDRQTMGSVVQELRASLSEVEKAIDKFFRNPGDHAALHDVPVQLSSMRGVLSVLGMDAASQALLRMRDEVDGLVSTEVDPDRVKSAGVFERLAGNLSALGFMIDMLSVQPQTAKSLFVYDAAAGTLAPVMGRSAAPHPASGAAPVEPRLLEQAQMLAFTSVREDVPVEEVSRDLERLSHEAQAADQPALAAAVLKAQDALVKARDPIDVASARGELSEALVDFVATSTEPAGFAPVSAPVPLAPMKPITLVEDFEHDDEMREVFLEEAREVVESARTACIELRSTPGDLELLTTLRRAFHTLKGSSRMVGLKSFGEAAWSCEQVFNTQLAEQRAAEAPLIEFSEWVLAYLGEWVEDIAAHRSGNRNEREVQLAAGRLAGGGAEPASDIALPIGMPPDLPSRSDLDLRAPEPAAAEPVAESADLSFELDLSSLDRLAEPGSAPDAPAVPMPTLADSSAMFDRFDDARSDAMQTTLANADFDDVSSGLVDLDLGSPGETPRMIQSLAPSEGASGQDSVAGLSLDLSTGEVHTGAPADFAASGMVDFEVGSDAGAGETPADEHVKIVGPLRIGIPLFNIYLNEADELSRRLMTEVAEWAMELHRPVGEVPIALAHSLAGSSATVGFTDLSHLARSLEHALARTQVIGHGTDEEARLFVNAAEDIRRLLHQFAAGFLLQPSAELLARLAEHELSSALRLEAATAASELAEGQESESPIEPAIAVEPLLSLDEMTDAPVAANDSFADAAPVGQGPIGSDAAEPAAAAAEDIAAGDVAETPAAAADAFPAIEPEPDAPAPFAAAAPLAPVVEPRQTGREAAANEPSERAEAAASVFGGLGGFNTLGVSELKPLAAAPLETARAAPARASTFGEVDDDIDAIDAVDLELFPIFEEEAQELLPKLDSQLRDWLREPVNAAHAGACMRTLHTLKGGARLAGAMRLGEMAHRLETRIERLTATDAPAPKGEDVEALQAVSDAMTSAFEALRSRDAQAYSDAVAAATAPLAPAARPSEPARTPIAEAPVFVATPIVPASAEAAAPIEETKKATSDKGEDARERGRGRGRRSEPAPASAPAAEPATIDWSRFARDGSGAAKPAERTLATQSAVRVRAPLLDRLVNQAGEVSITRSRIESGVGQIKGSLSDLTENLERLRGQLRDIELQGEVQMTSRLEAAKAASQSFDPLEFDRFTRFQELTRMMAESVNDVATVQRTLQRSLETTEDELVAQARLTRDLQDDLLRTRMVEFEGLSDRLYRVVRLAAKETGKQVRLDIVGGSIEIDRGVLDRMTGAFEHLLRNCVSHGIEPPEARKAAGKDPTGTIVVSLSHEGNEVGVEFRDDGGGLDLARIRTKGESMKLLEPGVEHSDAELANLIFTAGFSTVDTVTELAGRGVGMDVVRSDVIAMGGRIETATAAGQGTSFKLVLPLTTAVTQVVMLRCGDSTVAVPSTLVEIVRRATPAEIEASYASGSYEFGGTTLPFFWLGALLQLGSRPGEGQGRMRTVVVVRSAQQRIAVHVDEVLGNQEVVVKNLGPQLSRLPGLAGMTLLASGAVALIYNPVALATLYGDAARAQLAPRADGAAPALPSEAGASAAVAPLVLVVDDSLTVRRVTQRLLVREGYRVTLAKDGLDALERLAEEIPQVVLSDIEMPRMDGFDLVRNIRSDARWRDLPVIMITSRIAQKHRDHATELGVDHYLGKPYSEEDLLALIARYIVPVQAEA
ncbi:MAG TPA: Hpt domain-containing protein [Caldimonas sp.]|jgi:chemosensory pili system protein ChpA (sensor histidine kinase/response regulator)|nr:Hpt domain-containing protein [Caldimonas sp.]HEV7575537.1 Hpt domain-containing protein [Caldimonas sp.]